VIASIDKNRQSRWQVIVCKSEGQFMQVSFVNGIYTSKGGTHVNYILDQIIEKIFIAIAKKKQPPIKPFQLKAQLKIFINCLI
jgi:DNA topoisomerase II